MKIYDKHECVQMSKQDIINSCAFGMIALDEADDFSNREKYLCHTAEWYRQNLIKQEQRLEHALYDMVSLFCSYDEYGSRILPKKIGSKALRAAVEELRLAPGECIDGWVDSWGTGVYE